MPQHDIGSARRKVEVELGRPGLSRDVEHGHGGLRGVQRRPRDQRAVTIAPLDDLVLRDAERTRFGGEGEDALGRPKLPPGAVSEDLLDAHAPEHFADHTAGNILVRVPYLIPQGPLIDGHEPLGARRQLKGARRHGPARRDIGDSCRADRGYGRACACASVIGVESQRALDKGVR